MLRLELMNAIAQSICLSLMLLHYECDADRRRKAGYFFLCLALDSAIVVSGVWLNLSLLLHIPVLIFFINQRIKHLSESILNVLIAVNLFVCSFSLFGSILFLFCNAFVAKGGISYNLSFCIVVVASSAVYCLLIPDRQVYY